MRERKGEVGLGVTGEWGMELCFGGTTVEGNWGGFVKVRVCLGTDCEGQGRCCGGTERDKEEENCKGLTTPCSKQGQP